MKKIVVFSFYLLLLTANSMAQNKNGLYGVAQKPIGSLEVSVGSGYCFGDQYYVPNASTFITTSNWNASIGYRRLFQSGLAYKATLGYSNYSGFDDASHIHGAGIYSFTSKMIDLNVRGEYQYDFWKMYLSPSRISSRYLFSIYTFLGVGMLNSAISFPETAYVGRANTIAAFIPVGGGLKFHLTKKIALGPEVKLVYAMSDYIDGYCPPPKCSKYNDVLMGLSLALEYAL